MSVFLAPWMPLSSSSNFSCKARESRFWVFWMIKTIKSVTMVVKVLIKSCQVFEKLNMGPVRSHTIIIVRASIKACGLPAKVETFTANFLNHSFIFKYTA